MNQLSQADRELLEAILLKDLSTLTQEDIDILNARVDYLTYPQKIAYAPVLRNFEGADVPPVMPAAPTQYTDPTAKVEEAPVEPVAPVAPVVPEVTTTPAEVTSPATTEVTTAPVEGEAPVDPANPYDTDPAKTSELAQ